MGGGVWNERGIWNERGCLKKNPLSWQKQVEFEKIGTIEYISMSGVMLQTPLNFWGSGWVVF